MAWLNLLLYKQMHYFLYIDSFCHNITYFYIKQMLVVIIFNWQARAYMATYVHGQNVHNYRRTLHHRLSYALGAPFTNMIWY